MPFAETWIDLETVTQSEVGQKQKTKYCMISLLCDIQKNDVDEIICRVEIETQRQRTKVWTPRREKTCEVGWETGTDI